MLPESEIPPSTINFCIYFIPVCEKFAE